MAKLMKWMYRVEVGNKKSIELVREFAEAYGAKFVKGKAHGKSGHYVIDCYVEAEPFGGRDYLRDKLARHFPDVCMMRGGELMEVMDV